MKKDSGFGAQGVEMKLRGWGSGCGSGFKVYSNSFLGVYAIGKTVLMATLVDTEEVASTIVDNTALAMLKLMAALGMIGVA